MTELEALFDAVIVKPQEEEETTYGSIVVPDLGKDRNEHGEVVAVGPGHPIDEPSTTHRELFFDIETEMGDALTPEYIQNAPKKVTSIAWYDKQVDEWGILILDTKNQLEHTKFKN